MTTQNAVRSVAPRAASAVDLVLHEIRRSILTGALVPGEPLVVQTLTEQLGVSHVPVREALRQLEAQGMIKLSRSKSAVVAPLSQDDLASIYRLRLCMEPELAAQSVDLHSDADLTVLAELVEEMVDTDGTEQMWELHRSFHAGLISPAAGEWGLRFLTQLWDASERYSRLILDPVGAPKAELGEREQNHRVLVAAVTARDADELRKQVRLHLEHNASVMQARLSAMTD